MRWLEAMSTEPVLGTTEDAIPGKVLLVGPSPPPHGGISVHVVGLRRRLEAEGCRVKTFDVAKGEGSRATRAARLYREVSRHRVAGWRVHVHISGHGLAGWMVAGMCGGMGPGGGSLITIHSGLTPAFLAESKWPRTLVRTVCRRFSRVICVNDEIRSAIDAIGVSPETTAVIPAFIPPDEHGGKIPESLASWQQDRYPLITTALFFRPEYGFEVLLDALTELRTVYPRLGCAVMGDSAGGSAAQEMVGSAGLSGTVFLAGDLPHSQCLRVIKRSDVFVRPTLNDGDASSVREALCLGVRVVASRVGNRPPGTLLFEPGNGAELAERILEAIRSTPGRGEGMSSFHIRDLYGPRRPDAAIRFEVETRCE